MVQRPSGTNAFEFVVVSGLRAAQLMRGASRESSARTRSSRRHRSKSLRESLTHPARGRASSHRLNTYAHRSPLTREGASRITHRLTASMVRRML